MKRLLAGILVLAFMMTMGAYAGAQELPAPEGLKKLEIYYYKSHENRDPFYPLDIPETVGPGSEGVTPLESFNISQMRFVAILVDHEDNEPYALVGLPDGKFFNVREGTRIGLREGVVKRISIDRIIITEMIKDYKGQRTSQDTEIRLREPEDEMEGFKIQ